MLHVGEIDARPRQSKIQPFINLLLPIIKCNYTPDRQVAIDEAVISFRGRVSFRQYIKEKPNPWGIKAYVMSDSKSGYMHNLLLYYRKIDIHTYTHLPLYQIWGMYYLASDFNFELITKVFCNVPL